MCILADPSAAWYNWKESHSGQFYLLYKAALFICSESDTFLKNYNRNHSFSGKSLGKKKLIQTHTA